MSGLLKLAVSRWRVGQDASFAFRNRAKLYIRINYMMRKCDLHERVCRSGRFLVS